MDEHCSIGLHAFSDWREQQDMTWLRTCKRCNKAERRAWIDDPAPKQWPDPYRDLRQF